MFINMRKIEILKVLSIDRNLCITFIFFFVFIKFVVILDDLNHY